MTRGSGSGPGASRVDLYWIPLGAGGTGFVARNGRIYERWVASREHRDRLDLYHTALQVHVPEGRFVVETMWPCPDDDLGARGVVATGPVWSRRLPRARLFRYEVRRWRDGVLPDAEEAVGGPRCVSDDQATAHDLLDVVSTVPELVWGRDEMETGDWWNSNSVISWALARSGILVEAIQAPPGGRAPGWQAGIVVAARQAAGGKDEDPRPGHDWTSRPAVTG